MHFPAARHVRALHRVSQVVPALHLRNFHLTIPDLNFLQETFGSHLSFFLGLSLPQSQAFCPLITQDTYEKFVNTAIVIIKSQCVKTVEGM